MSPREEISRVLKENDAVGTFFVSGYIVINGSELNAKQSGLDGQNCSSYYCIKNISQPIRFDQSVVLTILRTRNVSRLRTMPGIR